MMRRTVVRYGRRIVAALGLLPFQSYADLPSDVDLRTAYCIRVVQLVVDDQTKILCTIDVR